MNEPLEFAPSLPGSSLWRDLKPALILTVLVFLFLIAIRIYGLSNPSIDRAGKAQPVPPFLPQLLALGICFASSIAGRMAITDKFEQDNPVASVMGGILIRMMFLLGAIAFSSATKWTSHNLFAGTLVGCYFSFLALESSLAIRRTSTRSRF